VVISAWVLGMAGAVWLKLNTLGMGFDLGMYEQVIWNTAQGRFFATSAFTYTQNHIGADLIVLEAILAPLYGVLPTTMTLLIAQVLSVAAGAVPLYLLARARLHSGWAGVILALAYLCYAPLLYLTLNEFQPRAFALVLILFAVYFLDRTRWAAYLGFLFLALLTRSDVALIVFMIGVLALLWRKPLRFSLVPMGMGAAWFVAAVFYIVPLFQTTDSGFIYFETYGWLGNTPGEMLATLLTRPLYVLPTVLSPQKLEFLGQVWGPTLPFSLLRPDVLLLAAPTLALNLLSQFNVQSNITRQYAALLYPVVFASAVLGIAWVADHLSLREGTRCVPAKQSGRASSEFRCDRVLGKRVPRAAFVHVAVLFVLLLTLAENFTVGNPVIAQYRKTPSPRVASLHMLLDAVPPDAGLGVSNHVGPFAGQRKGFYFFPPHQYYTNNTFEVSDYILVDVRSDGNGAPVKQGLERLRSLANWELVGDRDGYVLYRKR
jgi:uncharacterized membrane protein